MFVDVFLTSVDRVSPHHVLNEIPAVFDPAPSFFDSGKLIQVSNHNSDQRCKIVRDPFGICIRLRRSDGAADHHAFVEFMVSNHDGRWQVIGWVIGSNGLH